jgi:hypothetical protein
MKVQLAQVELAERECLLTGQEQRSGSLVVAAQAAGLMVEREDLVSAETADLVR